MHRKLARATRFWDLRANVPGSGLIMKGCAGMPRTSRRPPMNGRLSQDFSSLIIVFTVFGLVLALILAGYDPTVSAGTVAATSMTAAELVHRVRENSKPKHTKSEEKVDHSD